MKGWGSERFIRTCRGSGPRRTILAASLCALFVAGCAQVNPPPGEDSSLEADNASPPVETVIDPVPPRAVPGEYLVKFRIADPAGNQGALDESSVQTLKTYRNQPSLYLVKVAEDGNGTRVAAELARRDDVEYVEPNFYIHENVVPDDPSFNSQWGLLSPAWFGGVLGADMNATAAWDITTGSHDVVVAVVDSGVDYTHEDLAANIYSSPVECIPNGVDDDGNGYIDDCHGIDAADHDSDPMDPRGHGTHVAGILGAVGNNGIGIAGVAWQVRILPCRFIDSSGQGSTAGAIECLDYITSLRQAGVNVVASNNSWGQNYHSRALDEAILRQQQAGILFVAAAGNDGLDVDKWPEYPCGSERLNVICVAATSMADLIALNWGRHRVLVQAPGLAIWSTYPGNAYTPLDGTSMAAPHVSGVIALLASQDPTRDWRALRNLVAAGAEPHTGASLSFHYNAPHLDAGNSLSCSNRVALKRLRPVTHEVLQRPVGASITVSVLHVDCASPAGMVTVAVQPAGTLFLLQDDGTGEDELAGDGIYTGTWTVPAAGDYTLSVQGLEGDLMRVKGMAGLKPGFPVLLNVDPDRSSWIGGRGFAITVGNIVGDANQEILVPGLLRGPLFGLDHAGVAPPGWPSHEASTASLPSIGEIDGDPAVQEVVADFRYGGLRRLSATGITLEGWPRPTAYWSPVLADLDGDGRDEIISQATYRADGSPFSSVAGIPASQQGPQGAGAPLVADLDGDGLPDVVNGDEERIWAVNAAGHLPGFPVTRAGQKGSMPRLVGGDVDGDGEPEIIHVHAETRNSGPPQAFAYLYSHRGVLERTLSLGDAPGLDEPILADLDGDGIPELVVSLGTTVGAYRSDGTSLPGWPFVLAEGEYATVPRAGDISGDGRPEVVFQAYTTEYLESLGSNSVRAGFLYAVDAEGAIVPGFPKASPTALEASPEPAIADLDQDGRNEYIQVAPGGFGYRDALFAWDFSTGPTGPVEWGQFRGGAGHRGFYETGKNLADAAFLAAHAQGRGTITATGIACGTDCIQAYPKGTAVLLTATPAEGATFEGWSGACSGTGLTCAVTVNRFTAVTARFTATVTVQFAGSGAGEVSSSPSGIHCTTDCSQAFPGGSGVTLTAVAAAGSDFDGWSGACTGFDPECRLAADGAMQVTANFTTGRRLHVEKTGEGTGSVVSTPSGINCGSTCSAVFEQGSQVVLTATPGPGSYVFGWQGPCIAYVSTIHQCTATMDVAKSVKVVLSPSKKISVHLTGEGSGSITSELGGMTCTAQVCTELVKNGQTVKLTAHAAQDSEFTGWGGQCSGYTPTCTVSAFNADVEASANFALRSALQPLQVSTAGDAGIGKITASNGDIDCGLGFTACMAYLPQDSTVTLTAVWGANGTFSGWSGDCAGTGPNCTLTMDRARNATATFTLLPRLLTVTIGGDSALGKVTASVGINCGQGASVCSATVPHNTSVVLTATPHQDGRFSGWGGSCAGSSTTCTVVMNAARSVTATFASAPPPVSHLLQVVVAGGGTGRVSSQAAGINCGQGATACSASVPENTTVALTAVPGTGSVLTGWSGACSGSSATCTVGMSEARNVTATFGLQAPQANQGGGGSSGGGGGGGTDRLSLLGLLFLVAVVLARRSALIYPLPAANVPQLPRARHVKLFGKQCTATL